MSPVVQILATIGNAWSPSPNPDVRYCLRTVGGGTSGRQSASPNSTLLMGGAAPRRTVLERLNQA